MCVKVAPRDLNHSLYPPHPTSTYIYRVTIAPKVCGDYFILFQLQYIMCQNLYFLFILQLLYKIKKMNIQCRFGLDVCVYKRVFSLFFFFFFPFFLAVVIDFHRQNSLFMNSACTVHVLKNIKNGSHGTIHTFKNYFTTVFSVFQFQ